MSDRYNQPSQGAEEWHVPLNENFADLGIEVAEEVADWGSLPDTSSVKPSSNGQWPVYRVEADDVFVRVTDSTKEIVGGLGSADHPLPETRHESISTEELSSVYDRRISTTSQLESLPTDSQAGETVAIQQPDTPYRPESWSSGGKLGAIDVSNVTVRCESPYAANGEPLVKPADGSNIGGLIVGESTAVSNVDIIRWGFHGNESTMDNAVKRLHGITFANARDCSARDFVLTRLHPRHVHSSGGSGVTCRDASQDCTVVNGLVDETGDRCIQIAGNGHRVGYNTLINGFDRAVSFNVNEPGGEAAATNSVVFGNYARDMREGSAYAHSGSVKGRAISVVGNVAEGTYRGLVELTEVKDSVAVGNVGYHAAGVNVEQNGLELGSERNVAIGNTIYDPDGAHVALAAMKGANGTFAFNSFYSGGGNDGIVVSGAKPDNDVVHNHVEGVRNGIVDNGGERSVIRGNRVVDYGGGSGDGNGIDIQPGSGSERIVHGNYVHTGVADNAGVRLDSNGAEVTRNKLTGSASWSVVTPPKHAFGNSPVPFTSSVPGAPREGSIYPDDGTNTASSTKGLRMYLGGTWIDWITAE